MMNNIIKENFWKAYLLTIAQILSLIALIIILYSLFISSVSAVYPMINTITAMQATADISAISEQFYNNLHLYNNFVLELYVLLFGSVLLISGVLSYFDYLITDQLINRRFIFKDWLFEWYRYCSIGLLWIILLHVLFYNILAVPYLLIILAALFFITSYLIILMQFRKNMIYLFKTTMLRAVILIVLYGILGVISLLLTGLFRTYGFAIVFCLWTFMLLWSKIYLMKKR